MTKRLECRKLIVTDLSTFKISNRWIPGMSKIKEFFDALLHRSTLQKAVGIAAGLSLFIVCLLLFLPWRLPFSSRGIQVTVSRGLTPKEIATLLKHHDVIRSPQGFLVSARILGWTRKLKAGRYRFHEWENHFSILSDLSKGRAVSEKITFPEGIRASKIAAMLKRQMGVDSASVMAFVQNREFCRRLNVDAASLEGYLYPDTYLFQTSDSAEHILARMVARFQEMLPDSLKQKAGTQGRTVHELVTLASLVEGEAVLDSERSTIAAIYINRLKGGFPLQACPTIQYLIPGGPRHLLDRDLKIESPYNTYLHPGLPPGPVNNPGLRSIRAVLYPASVRYLYLVANGDGSHTFSYTLDEHNIAKRRFNRVRQQNHIR